MITEQLAMEIERVILLREQYKALKGVPQVNPGPAIVMMTASINNGFRALASGEATDIFTAINDLKGYTS